MGRSGSEPPATKNTSIVSLGSAGELAQTNAPTRQKWRWGVQVTVPRQQFERRKRQSRERSKPAREWQRWEPARTACKYEWLACDKYRRRPRPENFGDGESYRHCLLPQHLARIRSGQPAKADPGCSDETQSPTGIRVRHPRIWASGSGHETA